MIKCAAVQTDPRLGDPVRNLEDMHRAAERCAAEGARLIVFPECSPCGYCFESRDEGLAAAEEIPGRATAALAATAADTGTYLAAGLLERAGERLYNSAVLIGPQGDLLHTYRKTHLPTLGVDRFVDPGADPFPVIETPIGRIGILICYDLFFPEPARVLMLAGADLLAVCTNWPAGREAYPEHVIRTRARDNHLYVIAANRVGEERGTAFYGRSQICDPDGRVLAEAAAHEPDIVFADIEPRSARNLKVVLKPGQFELDLLKDRRPDLYGPIVAPLPGAD